jgi:porin
MALHRLISIKPWAARLDSIFPLGDSLLQDYGGWRSTLAQYGIGLLEYNAQIGSVNMLNTPTAGLGPSNATSSNPLAGNSRQQYFGQRPGFLDVSLAFLTIDTSQWGIPDGQIGISGNWSYSGDQHQVQNKLSNNGVSWYQTFFNKALEVKAGIFPNGDEWVGVAGGNLQVIWLPKCNSL